MDFVSCIIPYYNEEDRIVNVVKKAIESDYIKEVIMVDDGSTDQGLNGFDHEKLIQIRHPKNLGKSAAMKTGFFAASEKFILFLDADLNNLTTDHLDCLIEPVHSGAYNVSLSKRELFSFFDVLTGDRVMVKKEWENFFKNVQTINNGTEIRMNRFILLSKMDYTRINWKGVTQTYKAEKVGYFKGMKKDFSYVSQWMRELGYACYCVTYLFFWIIMLSKKSERMKFLLRNIYCDMFIKTVPYL